MIRQPLAERLVAAKYLFECACTQLEGSTLLAEGVAALSLQDCVELVLRVIARHTKVTLKQPIESFPNIITKIEEKTSKAIPFREELVRLNTLRVAFKHDGALPRPGEVRALEVYVEAFLHTACKEFLGLSFNDFSLADAISNDSVGKQLKQAETELSSQKYQDAIFTCTRTWGAVLGLFPRRREQSASISVPRVRDRDMQESLNQLCQSVEERLRQIEADLSLSMDGIDLRLYHRFKQIGPVINRTMGGREVISDLHGDDHYTRENAQFCVRFLIDTALLAEQQSQEKASRL